LADAIATGFVGSKVPESRRAKLVQEWSGNWAQLGWICAPDLEPLMKG